MKRKKNILMELLVLQRSLPGIVLALFVMSVVSMNLLANKSINLPVSWLALDCGILFSWLIFLLMDIVTRSLGPRAATLLSVMALICNLFIALMLFIAAKIPGMWGEAYVDGSESLICNALDHTIAGTWYVLLGSSIAFLVSAVVNNYLNWAIRRIARGDSFYAFAVRAYVSTFVAQFCDNLLFALIVSHHFFGWTMLQCFTCAITGAIVELLCEVIFSPIGFTVSKRWKRDRIGAEYLKLTGLEELLTYES